MTWLLTDPLGQTLLVLPLFSIAVLTLSAGRIALGWRVPVTLFPVLYLATLGAVLWLVTTTMGGDRAEAAVTAALSLSVATAGAGVLSVALTPALYLGDLALAEQGQRVASWRRRRATARPSPFRDTANPFVVAPVDAGEALDAVRELSRAPVLFGVLSVTTAIAEELLYRVLMLTLLSGVVALPAAVAVQALAYAVNHLPFGVSAMVAKCLLGVTLGVIVVLTGSVLPAIAAHCAFQLLVWRRFRRVDRWA